MRLSILIRKRYSVAADAAAPDRRATTPHIRLGIRTFPIRSDTNARRAKLPEPPIDDLTFGDDQDDRKGKGAFSRVSDPLDVFRRLLLVLRKRLRLARLYAFAPLSSSSPAIVGVSAAAAWKALSLRSLRFLPIALATGYMLCDFLTFRLANMAAFSHGTPPEWIMLPVGLALSLAGLLLGRILRRFVSGKD